MRFSGTVIGIIVAFFAGLSVQSLYQRWNSNDMDSSISRIADHTLPSPAVGGGSYRVHFLPLPTAPSRADTNAELVNVLARDIQKVRSLTGQQARIRGRVFRVGHSIKSNTYFLDFGPSREALTAVIFNSAVELFEKNRQSPKQFENRDVEIVGFIKDHPQYGLEVILEHPKQIKVLN